MKPHRLSLSRAIVLAIVSCICFGGWSAPVASGQDSDVASESTNSEQLRVGIAGHYRKGMWTAVRLKPGESTIETLDGDGIRVAYQQSKQSQSGDGDGRRFGYVIPGSEGAPLNILDADSKLLVSERFPIIGVPARGPAMLPAEMPWVVCIGDPMGVDKIGENKRLRRESRVAVSRPDPDQFPDSAIGYSGVDLMIIHSSGHETLARLNDRQTKAISDWVRQGGELVLGLGDSATSLATQSPWLIDLLPLDTDVSIIRIDPVKIETFLAAQTPLDSFDGIKLPRKVGEVLVDAETKRGVITPFVVEYVVGMGQVTVVAADLDRAPFAEWSDRMDLIKLLTGSVLFNEQDKKTQVNRVTAFSDLAGQARATLDQFSVSRRYGFSVLALVLMALIALVGPLDYLLINRVFGKPLLGWLSFPIVVLGISAVLVSQSASVSTSSGASQSAAADATHSAENQSIESNVRCNRMEIVDIDATIDQGRAFAWAYAFSHEPDRIDVDVQPSEAFGESIQDIQWNQAAPFGHPGKTFGGIQIAGEDPRMGSYSVVLNKDEDGPVIRGLALAPRSSKSFANWTLFEPSVGEGVVLNRARRGVLSGELENPLPYDLINGMLVYRNTAYLLPTRFPKGGRIKSLDKLQQKSVRWQLARRGSQGEDKSDIEDWDPSNFKTPVRLAEILMFHETAGGTKYTSLENHPLSFLDFSHLLSDDRCVLVGQLRKPMFDITLNRLSSGTEVSPVGETVSMIRIVLPVKPSRR